MAIPGLVAYVDAAFVHLDAQGGLVFVFAPLLQWAAVAALGVGCALLPIQDLPRFGGTPYFRQEELDAFKHLSGV